MIAARNCGAMARLIEEAREFAASREVGGETLADKQMVQAMLADCVTDWWAARLVTFEVAEAHDRGELSAVMRSFNSGINSPPKRRAGSQTVSSRFLAGAAICGKIAPSALFVS